MNETKNPKLSDKEKAMWVYGFATGTWLMDLVIIVFVLGLYYGWWY